MVALGNHRLVTVSVVVKSYDALPDARHVQCDAELSMHAGIGNKQCEVMACHEEGA